jgi:NAD kinase
MDGNILSFTNEQLTKSLEVLVLKGINVGTLGTYSDYNKDEYKKMIDLYDKHGSLAVLGKFRNLRVLIIDDGGLAFTFKEEGENFLILV